MKACIICQGSATCYREYHRCEGYLPIGRAERETMRRTKRHTRMNRALTYRELYAVRASLAARPIK